MKRSSVSPIRKRIAGRVVVSQECLSESVLSDSGDSRE